MKRYLISGTLVFVLTVGVLLLGRIFPETAAGSKTPVVPGPETKVGANAPVVEEEPASETGSTNTVNNDKQEGAVLDEALNRQIIVARLKELFGSRIGHIRVQLQAIEKLIHYLKDTYPDDWQGRVFDFLSLAFPEQAAELYDNYLRLMDFKQWVADNYTRLVNMKAAERKDFLWAKRKQFFGDDAEVIWEMEIKAEQLAESLQQINGQQSMPFTEKINYYQVSMESIYADRADAYKQSRQQNLMDRFLELDSVQTDLARMSAREREANLARFRMSMGLDKAAVDRWAALDNLRDDRWENGRAYMRERERVLNQPLGPDREYRLGQLRQSYFGKQAPIIEQEEAAGLFRFQGERVYGKN